jgi:vacuolar-type H+-ATPase subunit E/Vma4
MSLDALLATLTRETDDRIATLLADARNEAESLVAGAEAARIRGRNALLAERGAALRTEAESEVSRVRREARAEVLAARADAVERVFARARERLAACGDDPGWLGATLGDLDAALACVAGAKVVRCRPAHAPELGRRLKGRADVTLEPDPGVGTGFVVTAADGSVTVDATLAARLEGERARLAIVAVRLIEAEP